MTNYRRNFSAGGTFFFTVALADRRTQWLTAHVDILRDAFSHVRNAHPFTIDAVVILPEHLHALWTLPDRDSDYATRWRLIKTGFSRALPSGELRSESRIARGERGIWQRRYWEHTIRDERDFERHMDYIHFNPVKHGHVKQVSDWPFSSFERLVQAGRYPPDWTADPAGVDGEYGEA